MKSSAGKIEFPGAVYHVLDRETISGSAYHYDGNFNLSAAPNWDGVYDAQSRLVYGAHAGNSVFFTQGRKMGQSLGLTEQSRADSASKEDLARQIRIEQAGAIAQRLGSEMTEKTKRGGL